MYRLVAFDMDGTIGDTYPGFFRSIQIAVKNSFGKECTIEDIVSHLGISDLGIIKAIAGEKWRQVFDDYLRTYEVIEDPAPRLFSGMKECVLRLKSRGIKLALVTGKCPESCSITLKRFGMEGVFDAVKTGVEDRNIKSENMSSAIEELGFDKEECCYVGDDLSDIFESKKAGIECYSAAWAKTESETEELKENNPGKVFLRPEDFINFILSHN